MTPSTSLTLEGFLRGLQPLSMWLIGALLSVLIIRWILIWLINKAQESEMSDDDAKAGRKFLNGITGLIMAVIVLGFAFGAANYATNAIPRAGLDRSSIDRDMNANIKR